jgi:hypothetical protein
MLQRCNAACSGFVVKTMDESRMSGGKVVGRSFPSFHLHLSGGCRMFREEDLTRAMSEAVGLGLVPRGELGLIFGAVGKSAGAVNDSLFAALVIVIIVTTGGDPPALKWSLFRNKPAPSEEPS